MANLFLVSIGLGFKQRQYVVGGSVLCSTLVIAGGFLTWLFAGGTCIDGGRDCIYLPKKVCYVASLEFLAAIVLR